jgi:hypothetical protein
MLAERARSWSRRMARAAGSGRDGGIGKTTLAEARVRQLAPTPPYTEIAWVSARTRLFHLTGRSASRQTRPSSTPHDLVDRLVEQLGLHISSANRSEKFLG